MEGTGSMSTSQESGRLSLAVIARNAAGPLAETLAATAAVCDQIVVVDTGSSDDTPQVAARFGAQLVQHAWQDDFSAARNCGLAQVTGDWVLWLDAGETLSGEDARGLRQFVDQQADAAAAYALLVQLPPHGANEAAEQIARIRLLPRHPGIRFAGRVRESVNASLDQNNIALRGLPYRIARGRREHDPQRKADKARRNMRLAQLELEQTGPQPHLLNCLGDACQTLDDNQQAAAFFRQALELAARGSIEMLEAYYGLLTSLDGGQDNCAAQLALSVEALAIFPLDAQLLCALGGYLQTRGQLDLAVKTYQTAYEHGQINPALWHVGEVREIAAICFSLTLQLQDRSDEARKVLERAANASQHGGRVRRHLMELFVKQGRVEPALEQLELLPPEMPHREALRSAVRGACFASQQNWIAARPYLETAYAAGCRDPFCLRWFAVTLLAAGEIAQAQPILEEWRAVEPANAEAARYQQVIDQLPPNAAAPDRQRTWRVDAHDPLQQPNTANSRAPTSQRAPQHWDG